MHYRIEMVQYFYKSLFVMQSFMEIKTVASHIENIASQIMFLLENQDKSNNRCK